MDRMKEYYSRRATEHEEIYARPDPIRQAEQVALAAELKSHLAGCRVIEVACGTGYWTRFVVETAAFVMATDVNREMLSIARSKNLPDDKAAFDVVDAYALDSISGSFDGALAMFWLSHVPRRRVKAFLDGLHARLSPGARVFMADNVFVPDVGGELDQDAGGPDTYKVRRLSDGSTYRIIKNYLTHDELKDALSHGTNSIELRFGERFWWVKYRI